MTSAQRNLAEIVAALVVLVGGYVGWRSHERSVGALTVVTQAVRDSAKVTQDSLTKATQEARQDSIVREKALSAARVQLARQRADSAKQDSIVRVSANERARAERLLADSLATVQALRDQLGRLAAQSRVDSVQFAGERAASRSTTASLLSVIAADSLTIHAERTRADRAEALAALRGREADLLRKQAPSVAGTVVKDALWLAAGIIGGRASK